MKTIAIVAFDNFTDIDVYLAWDLFNRLRLKDKDVQVKIVGTASSHVSSSKLPVHIHGQIEECNDADVVFFLQGGHGVTARYAIRHMRARGAKVGMVRLKTIRPYPTDRVMASLSRFKVVGVIETNMGLGSVSSGGSLYAEAVGALYESDKRPLVMSFMAGMGGEAIVLKEFYWMTNKMLEAQKRGKIEKRTHWVGFEE